MPNWCSTNIVIRNENEDAIRNLESEFKKAFECHEIANGFGDMWLGNILSYLGYTEKQVLYGNISCRGEVVDMFSHGKELRIYTDTAWVPMLEPFMLMVEKYASDSELIYDATEGGCGIHCTNDDSMVGTVYVDVFDYLPEELAWVEEVNYDGMTKDKFIKEVADSMGWDESEAEEKIFDELSEKFSLSEWEFAEANEW